MPPRLPSSTRAFLQISRESYICASCLAKASAGRQSFQSSLKRDYSTDLQATRTRLFAQARPSDAAKRLYGRSAVRGAASNDAVASRTAINAPTTVPKAYRELYQRLLGLQENASSYVDLSRLQLATRSLESSNPIIRVALLGLGNSGATAARKLARVLLRDVLSQEEAFENELLESAYDGRSLLLRYGDSEENTQSNSLMRTLNVPSRFLQRHNLELLVTTFNTDNESSSFNDAAAVEEAMLVPPLTTPNSADGRVGFVRYPVHKAVVVTEGIDGAMEYGRLPATVADDSLISVALSVPLDSSSRIESGEPEASQKAVDIDLAMHALNLFRKNQANGAQFSNEWQISRMPALAEWITGSSYRKTGSGLNPAVDNLISSLLARARTSISVSRDAEMALVTASTVQDPKRISLQAAITDWSADAHRDLQNNLDTAFKTSSSWRRTAWWRLFWRIDDVTISAANILRNSWLTEAEQRLAFLSGRIFDSGLATEEQLTGPTPVLLGPGRQEEMQEYETSKNQNETVAELMQMPSMLSRMQQQSGINALFNPPWPQNINLSRQYMLHTLVPDLHRKAQALLVTTLSTIGGSAALSAWFFIATAGIGIYESGAIIALGVTWSLRRLQKKWGREREDFAIAVREDARRVLGEVESHLRRVVNDGGKATVRPEDVLSWKEARATVDSCQAALEELRASG